MATPIPTSIFLSSPGDVNAERDLAQQVVEQFNRDVEFNSHFQLHLYRWDDPNVRLPMEAGETPQKSVDVYMKKPSECDLVVVVLWSRMGTRVVMDDREYLSGTHYEFSEALEGRRRTNGRPSVWLYRCTCEPDIKMTDPRRDERILQYDLVQQFFADFRDDEGRLKGGITEFVEPDDFAAEFAGQLRTYLRVRRDHPERLRELGFGETETDLDRPPYKGLDPLDESDGEIFFGRDRQVLELLALMKRQRFVMIVGASGSGKSSLAAAGVLPRLKSRGIWRIARMKPQTDPFANLGRSLAEGVPELRSQSLENIVAALRAGGESLDALLKRVLTRGKRVLLFIDQFEELFTLAEKAQGADTVRAFTSLLKHPSELYSVLVTMRADFYETALAHFEQELRQGAFSLGRPSPFALREMVERPAERANLNLDGDLAELIVTEVNDQPGALPLVAYLLAQMHRQMEERLDRRITRADYDQVGGVRGAISARAETAYAKIDLPDERKEAALNRVFREMVELTEEQGRLVPTRRRVSPETLMSDPDAALLVQQLTNERLLTSDRNTVEVAHEALFTSWKTLAAWILRVQDDLRLVRQFERDAHDWERRGRPLEGQPRNEQMCPFLDALKQLKVQVTDPLLVAYADLSPENMLAELEDIDTPQRRRLFIGERLGLLGDPRKGVGNEEVTVDGRRTLLPDIKWCFIEAQKDTQGRFPRLKIGRKNHEIRSFWIAKYPITNQQFQAFVDDPEGYTNTVWWAGTPADLERHKIYDSQGGFPTSPRDSVTWYQSVAFTRWLSARCKGMTLDFPEDTRLTPKTIGDEIQISLPTEWEWQWAAQGGLEAREYPWCGAWDSRRANTLEAELGESTVVGMYPNGAAAYGPLDMAGNLWEWCLNSQNSGKARSVRGGGFHSVRDYARCAFRFRAYRDPNGFYYNVGFRVVCATRN